MFPSPTQLNIGRVDTLFLGLPSTPIGGQQTLEGTCPVHWGRQIEFYCVGCQAEICLRCKLCEHDGHKVQSLQLAATEALEYITKVSNHQLKVHRHYLEKQTEDITGKKQSLIKRAQDVKEKVEQRQTELLRFLEEENQAGRARLLERHFTALQGGASPGKAAAAFHWDDVDLTVRRQHLVPLIKECAAAAVLGVDRVAEDLHRQLTSTADLLQHQKDRLHNIQARCLESVREKNQVKVLGLHRELVTDWSEDKLSSCQVSLPPVLLPDVPDSPCGDSGEDALLKLLLCDRRDEVRAAVQRFLGTPATETRVRPPRVLVEPAFRFCDSTEAHAFALCPGANKISVSYSPWSRDTYEAKTDFFQFDGSTAVIALKPGHYTLGTSCDVQADGFNFHFQPVLSLVNYWGRMVCQKTMYAKTGEKILMLTAEAPSNNPEAVLRSTAKVFGKWVRDKHEATFPGVQYPVAVDCSQGIKYVAVIVKRLTEQKDRDGGTCGHEVRVYDTEKGEGSGRCTEFSVYRPQGDTPFFPTDVCFFPVGGLEVLLVSELSDSAIHMVDPGSCRLQDRLVQHHPALRHPTALNKDTGGRLWVACRGGMIVTVTLLPEKETD